MKQDRISKITRKAIEAPMGFTQSLMEKTERVKTPSPRVDMVIICWSGHNMVNTICFDKNK